MQVHQEFPINSFILNTRDNSVNKLGRNVVDQSLPSKLESLWLQFNSSCRTRDAYHHVKRVDQHASPQYAVQSILELEEISVCKRCN